MTEMRKWKLSDLVELMKNIVISIFEGKLLLRLQANRYFIHIFYTFFLIWVSIWLSLKIEKTLTVVEENRRTLSDIEIYHTQKTVELEGYSRLSNVQEMLKNAGSKLEMPVKPADRIKR